MSRKFKSVMNFEVIEEEIKGIEGMDPCPWLKIKSSMADPYKFEHFITQRNRNKTEWCPN